MSEDVNYVKEVCPGLFQICLELPTKETKRTMLIQFPLHGSQLGKSLEIQLLFFENGTWGLVFKEVKSCMGKMVDSGMKVDSNSNGGSTFQPKHYPKKMWLKDNVGNTLPLVFHEPTKEWIILLERSQRRSCIEVWMKFGNKEVVEKKILDGLAGMFDSQSLCDVHFHFKCGNSIGAHVAVLSGGSPVFNAMFQSEFVESKTRRVVIDDIEMKVFNQLLKFLYQGKAPDLANDESISKSLYEAADKYGVVLLQKECVNKIVCDLSTENVIEWLVWAEFHSIKKLFKKAMSFIIKNCNELCSQPEWLDFMKNHPDLCVRTIKVMASILSSVQQLIINN